MMFGRWVIEGEAQHTNRPWNLALMTRQGPTIYDSAAGLYVLSSCFEFEM